MGNKKITDGARRQEMTFLAIALAFPLLHFFLLYVMVNVNSVLLSFKSYKDGEYTFVWFENFVTLINNFKTEWSYKKMLTNSLKMYLFYSPLLLVATSLVAYSVWKKVYFSKFFSTLLFLPSVLSSIVFVMIGRLFITKVFPIIFRTPSAGMILNPPVGFYTVTIFGWLLQFGPNMIYFLGAMSGISPELVEYGELEGVNSFKEFKSIVFPSIYPTIVSLVIVGIAQIFVNQGLLLSFYDVTADVSVKTFGYYIFVKTQTSINYESYPEIAAMGLMFTFITIPVVFTVKWLMEKFGPSED